MVGSGEAVSERRMLFRLRQLDRSRLRPGRRSGVSSGAIPAGWKLYLSDAVIVLNVVVIFRLSKEVDCVEEDVLWVSGVVVDTVFAVHIDG